MMHPARRSYLAHRLAPLRVCIEMIEHTDGDAITGIDVVLECGHTESMSLHHMHRTGERYRCMECGYAAVLVHPEYSKE